MCYSSYLNDVCVSNGTTEILHLDAAIIELITIRNVNMSTIRDLTIFNFVFLGIILAIFQRRLNEPKARPHKCDNSAVSPISHLALCEKLFLFI